MSAQGFTVSYDEQGNGCWVQTSLSLYYEVTRIAAVATESSHEVYECTADADMKFEVIP